MSRSLPFERLRASQTSCGSVLLILAATPVFGLTVLTHYLAHRLGDPLELGPLLVPVLPRWVYLAAGGAALYAAFRLAHRGRRLVSLGAALPGIVLALLARGPVYLPHQGLGWSTALLTYPQARGEILEAVAVSLAATLLAAALGLALWRSDGSKRSPSAIAHGSSRPAGARDLREAGLLGSLTGIHLGAWRSHGKLLPLRDDSEDHVLLVMPSGAGKTSGTIVPTLLTSEHPAIVLDPKGEIYRLTSGWRRRMGHRCIYYSPSSPDSPAWNCLDEISRDSEIADLRVLAENLVAYPSYPASDQGASHWTASARNLLRLLCLHALHAHPRPSLPSVLSQLHEGKDPYDLFETIGSYPHDPDKGFRDLTTGEPTATHPQVALLANAFGAIPDRELGSIISTLGQFLALWDDPRVARASSKSDFTLEEICDPAVPTTLYIALPYGDLQPLAPLLRVLLALLTRRLTQDRPVEGPAGSRRLLFVLDEFAALGRIPIIEQMLAFFRGYGVRALLVVQDLTQLKRAYSEHEGISGACQIHVLSASQSGATRRHLSRLAGETTVTYSRRSVSGGRMALLKTRSSRTNVEVKRPLITEGEAGTLPKDRVVVLKTGLPPVVAWRLAYFEDSELSRRAAMPPPEEPDLAALGEPFLPVTEPTLVDPPLTNPESSHRQARRSREMGHER